MPNKLFGEVLSEGILSVKALQGRKISDIEEDIAEALGYAPATVQSWKKGSVPIDETQVEFLARYIVQNGKRGRQWLNRFLTQARYYDRQRLLDELCPEQAALAAGAKAVYHNLPSRSGEFLGREKEMAQVIEGLASRWPLISIEGMGGIGKTTLATEVGYACLPGGPADLDDPFEACVFISAKDRPITLSDLLDTIARVLNYPYIIQQTPPAEKSTEVDRLLRGHRVLIIADNFETVTDPALITYLQNIPEPSKALITTRHGQLRAVWPIPLRGLADAEALELIHRHARRLRLPTVAEAKDEALKLLVDVTGGNPYAIVTALGYLKGGSLALDSLVNALYRAGPDMDKIFNYIFNRAWEILSQDARHLLMVMPFFVESASKAALGAAAEVEGYYLDTAISQLVEMSLLEVNDALAEDQRRYSVHPLTLAFAGAKLREALEWEREAREQWKQYFFNFVAYHVVREEPKERYWNSLGLTLIDPEWPNLLNVLAWAAQNKEHQTLIELMMLLVHYMDRLALYAERILYARKAAEAANKLGQKMDEALFRIDALGWTLIEQGYFADAEQEITKGLRIIEDFGTESADTNDLIALAYAFLARVYLMQEDIVKASELIDKAMLIECRLMIQRRVTVTAGELAYRKQDYQAAITLYKDAIRLEQQYDGEGEEIQHQLLGFAYLAQGELAQAEAEFEELSDLKQQTGTIEAIYQKYGLACVAQAKGEIDKAVQLAQEALEAILRLHIDHRLQKEIEDFLSKLEASQETEHLLMKRTPDQ